MSSGTPLSPLEPWIAAKIGLSGEPLSREAIEAYQLARLNATLTLARTRSSFYRSHLAGAPANLASLEEVAALPFTTSADIRERGLRMLCVSQDEIQRVVTLDTSGTTGNPKRLYFTRADQELTVDFFRVGMSTFTEPGDTALILLPCERPGSVGDLLATALTRMGARPIKHGLVSDVAETLAVMRRERVDCLIGVPTQVLAAAAYGAGLKLKSVLLSTDHVPRSLAARVEAAWDCAVYNHYGMTEMGLGGGVDCRARRGYHLREADLLFEVIDPVTAAPLPAGETGEIVFTTLTRQGMPLIRYRTGDAGRFAPGSCPCGASLKTLARVTHRLDRAIWLGERVLTMADLDEALFALPGVLDFAARVDRAGHDVLAVDVTAIEEGATVDVTKVRATLETIAAIRDAGELETVVTVAKVGYRASRPAKRAIADRRSGGETP